MSAILQSHRSKIISVHAIVGYLCLLGLFVKPSAFWSIGLLPCGMVQCLGVDRSSRLHSILNVLTGVTFMIVGLLVAFPRL